MNYARRLARRLSTRKGNSTNSAKKLRRRLFAERLEERSLLAGNVAGFVSDYYNQGTPADVDANGEIAPLDALIIINRLNADGGGALPQGMAGAAGESGRLYVDVSNDGELAPFDALLVINSLNAEGEDPSQPTDVLVYELRLLNPATGAVIAGNTVSIGQQVDLQLRVSDVRSTFGNNNIHGTDRGAFSAYTDILIAESNGGAIDLFDVGVSEIQTITILGTPASGSFTLTLGAQTTAPIALVDVDTNPLPLTTVIADIDAKLEALVGAGNILVDFSGTTDRNTGLPVFDVRFVGSLFNTNQPLMTTNAGGDITVEELNPTDPDAFREAFRSVALPGQSATGSQYQSVLSAGELPDRFDDVGAVAFLTSGSPGTGFKEVARVRLLVGNQAGTVTFTPDFTDLVRSTHDSLVYSSIGVNSIVNGTASTMPARVTAAASASNFTAAGLADPFPGQPAVGDKIKFLNGPAVGPDTSNPVERTITAFNPATGEITVDQAFPAAPVPFNAFIITLTTPKFIDLVGATPANTTLTIVSGPFDAVNDTAVVAEDAPGGVSIDVLANDTTTPTGGTKQILSVVQPASGGTVTFTPNSSNPVTFTPALNFNGQATFTYTAKNNTADPGGANPDTATVTVTVNAVNDAPTVTNPGPQNVNEGGGTTTVNVTTGPGGGADEAAQQVILSASSNNPGVASVSTVGNVVTITGGTAGTATVTLTAIDDGSPNATTTVTFSVTAAAVNDPPDVTAPPTATTDVDTNLTFSTANGNAIAVTDPDAGSGTIQVTITSSNGSIQGGTGNTRTLTGTLASIQSTLSSGITYVPPAGFDGNVTLTVVANDNGNTGLGGPKTDTATVNITVQPAVPKPIADNDTFGPATEDTPFVQAAPGVLDGDTDPISGRGPLEAVGAVMPAQFGTVTLNTDGSFTYNPAQDFNGPASFTYRARAAGDGTQSNPATVTINVTAANDAPVGVPDGPLTVITRNNPGSENQPLDVLANDTDPDSPASSLVVAAGSLSAPGKGTVAISADGKRVLYTPNAGQEGPDSFTYRASDGSAESGNTLVSVNIINFVPKDVRGRVLLNGGNGTTFPLSGITVNLTGTDFNGQPVNLTAITNTNGDFAFIGVTPPQGSYTLTQVQPALFIDGAEVNSTSSPLATISGNDQFTLTWDIVNQDPLTGLQFIEQGINLAGLGDVTKHEQTAKAGPDGFWVLADLSGNTLWSFLLPDGGWESATSFDLDFDPANLAHATLNVGGLGSSIGSSIRIHQNPAFNTEGNYPPGSNLTTPTHVGGRFRVYGNLATGPLLFRIDGSAADFGLAPANGSLSAAGEGEGMSSRNFAEAADQVYGGGNWA